MKQLLFLLLIILSCSCLSLPEQIVQEQALKFSNCMDVAATSQRRIANLGITSKICFDSDHAWIEVENLIIDGNCIHGFLSCYKWDVRAKNFVTHGYIELIPATN